MAYIGSAEDARRIRKQEEEREKQRKAFEKRKQEGESNVDGAGLRQFGAGKAEVLEAAFKNETIGLVTREEFLKKKNTLKERLEEEAAKKRKEASLQAAVLKAERQKKKARNDAKAKLSFISEEEAPDEEAEISDQLVQVQGTVVPLRIGKNPEAETSFLPDRDREKEEEEIKKQIQQEYELREQVLRSEYIEVTYSYFDGSGHRRCIEVQRGDSIGEFLKKVREQLSAEFKELRHVSISSLMYVKEDMILPHTISFHDLIKKRIRGKTGPLFDFGVHEDVRASSDSRIQEKNDAHAGKVLMRSYYDRNKHIYPASKWEQLEGF